MKGGIQDNFLNIVRKEKREITIFLVNGVKVKGKVKSFDNFTILLDGDRQNLIYKHAISTIVPQKPVNLSAGESNG